MAQQGRSFCTAQPHLCSLAQALQQTQHDLVSTGPLAATPPQEVQKRLSAAVKPAAGGSRAVTRRGSLADTSIVRLS